MTAHEIVAYLRGAPEPLVRSARDAYRVAEAYAVRDGWASYQVPIVAMVALELQVICDGGLTLIEGMRT